MIDDNQDLFISILNKLNESIRIFSKTKEIYFVNKVLFSFFELKTENVTGLKSNNEIFGELGKISDSYFNNNFELDLSLEFIQKDKNGTKRYYEASYTTIDVNGLEPLILESVRDITPKKILDKEMMQKEKLASIGQVASSFAHEIKNPLTGIRLGLNLIKEDVKDIQIIQGIENDVKRLDQILEQLLNYSKVRDKFKEKTDINKLIEKTLILLRKQAEQNNIEILSEYSPIIPLLILDQNEIQQVIVNIILNAIQAIKNKGKIQIKTSNATITETLGVLVTIEDDGIGIDDSILHKINNLFFTTKKEGTGLGLPMSQKIIREHGGSIVFESEKGKGTLVKVFLPIEI